MNQEMILVACAAAQELINIAVATEAILDDTRSATSPYLLEINAKGRFALDVSSNLIKAGEYNL